jgi:hypothetical protein
MHAVIKQIEGDVAPAVPFGGEDDAAEGKGGEQVGKQGGEGFAK